MKFTVSSTTLSKSIGQIASVINSSNSLPILDYFLFDLNGGELTVTASDLETTASVKISVTAKEDGSIAIPAKLFLDALKSLGECPVTVDADGGLFSITITAGDGKFKMPGHSAEEYPRTPDIESPVSVTITSDTLSSVIKNTLFATGNDELRIVLSGVYFDLANGSFVATDAHKLSLFKTGVKGDVGFTVPKKPLGVLRNILSGGDVKMTYSKTNVSFDLGNVTLVCRLIDGKYPNYNAVIPTDNPNKLTIDRKLFMSVVKRVSIFANMMTHTVRLTLKDSELTVWSEDMDFNKEGKERVVCEYSGEEMEIGFNSRMLLELLNSMDSDVVMLSMSAPNKAGLLTPVGSEEDVTMLLMPVMLNKN